MRGTALKIIALAGALTIATGGVAWGLVTVYENGFGSKSQYKAVKKMSGGKGCKPFWDKKTRYGLRVVKGPKLCRLTTPVQGDRSGPDHQVDAKVKVNKATSKKVRKKVFVGVGVREAKKAGYQLRVYPQRQRWELIRNPSSDDFPLKGKLDSIKKVGKKNVVKLRAFGDTLVAFVNGTRVVAGVRDGSAAQVDGRKTTLVVGNDKKTKKSLKVTFDDVSVSLPNP